LRAAEAALRAGEVVIVLPQGTIPRGEAFFDPELKGKTGTARLAAASGAVVVPIGLWGTEKVWPRSARVPDFTLVRRPPKVTVTVGEPLSLSGRDVVADTATIMKAIAALLPDESTVRHEPTAEELARTKPPS
jgi:putative phosphoserine phosphatase / 1-acylglycerol-3-phosphate O-acyltransferase